MASAQPPAISHDFIFLSPLQCSHSCLCTPQPYPCFSNSQLSESIPNSTLLRSNFKDTSKSFCKYRTHDVGIAAYRSKLTAHTRDITSGGSGVARKLHKSFQQGKQEKKKKKILKRKQISYKDPQSKEDGGACCEDDVREGEVENGECELGMWGSVLCDWSEGLNEQRGIRPRVSSVSLTQSVWSECHVSWVCERPSF